MKSVVILAGYFTVIAGGVAMLVNAGHPGADSSKSRSTGIVIPLEVPKSEANLGAVGKGLGIGFIGFLLIGLGHRMR